jgi:adenine phosphoribosyltransferase
MTLEEIRSLVRDVPNFPKPGILFKDITPVLADPAAFRATIDLFAERVAPLRADGILAIESRGFIFGAALANRAALPLQLVRKRGKLPRESFSVEYELEYGVDHLEMHKDAVRAGGRYLIVDDVIATGGTAAAVAKLVAQQRASIAACVFLIELTFLNGRGRLDGHDVISLIRD